MTLEEALWQDPERMNGTVCFRGTSFPVSILFDYLQLGDLVGFFDGYPDVSRDMVEAILKSSLASVESSFGMRRTA